MSTPRYEPKVGDEITVELPDERTRAVIEKVVGNDRCIARLLRFAVSKSHSYRKGDLVACKHEVLSMNVAGWRVVSEREMEDARPAPKKKRKKG